MAEPTVHYDPIKYIFYLMIYLILFVILFNQNMEIIGFIVSFFVNLIVSVLMAFDLNKSFVASMTTSNKTYATLLIKNNEFINQVYLLIVYIGLIFNIIASLFMFLTMTSIQSSFAKVSMPVEFTPKNRDSIETYKTIFTLNVLSIFAIIFCTIFKSISDYISYSLLTITTDKYLFSEKIYKMIQWILQIIILIKPLFGVATLVISGYLIYIANDLMSMRINNLPPPPQAVQTALGIQTATIPLSNKSWNLSFTDFVKKYMNSYYLSNYVPFY